MLQEGNLSTRVCPSVSHSVHTITHYALELRVQGPKAHLWTLDLTVGDSPHPDPLWTWDLTVQGHPTSQLHPLPQTWDLTVEDHLAPAHWT